MTMAESNKLRVQCREARAEVVAFEWMDACWARAPASDDSRVMDCAVWRGAFPAARAVNVSNRKDLRDADFVHFVGLLQLDCSFSALVTDAAFARSWHSS